MTPTFVVDHKVIRPILLMEHQRRREQGINPSASMPIHTLPNPMLAHVWKRIQHAARVARRHGTLKDRQSLNRSSILTSHTGTRVSMRRITRKSPREFIVHHRVTRLTTLNHSTEHPNNRSLHHTFSVLAETSR